MTARLIALLLLAALGTLAPATPAGAQSVGDVFRRVSPSVVVIRSKGRDVSASGQVRFGEMGVLISSDGRVMTAAHVVHAMDEISVEFIGGETVPARVVASEPAADLSLLRSRTRQRPRWPPNSVYPSFPLAEFFQTDATINTGNSGGPLFNLAGDVIGIVSHNISKGGGSEGLGFVVTITVTVLRAGRVVNLVGKAP